MKSAFLISLIIFCSFSCSTKHKEDKVQHPVNKQQRYETINSNGNTVETRFNSPKGFIRQETPKESFAYYLRNLPLKPVGSTVTYYNGATKPNNNVYQAVVNLPIGKKDLHQCADAVMRLRAEYLWQNKEYDKIHFNFTNGFRVDYSEYMKGRRMVVKGNKTYWNNRNQTSNTYNDFWNYMELIFTYAGTASLEKELQSVNINNAQIGDVLIQGGYPGHAIIIVDKVINPNTNEHQYILAQSYMPAQELQILNNPVNNTVWYTLNTNKIQTPEWGFTKNNLKRF